MNWIFRNNINTDLITPGRHNITTDLKELAKIAFIEARPEFARTVKPGDLIIAGSNFGCGSSRETAPMALKACGIQAILARSFGRIFFRNCLNQGLLAITVETNGFEESDTIIIDLKRQTLTNTSKNKAIKISVPPIMIRLHEADGIIPFIKKYGIDAIPNLFTKI